MYALMQKYLCNARICNAYTNETNRIKFISKLTQKHDKTLKKVDGYLWITWMQADIGLNMQMYAVLHSIRLRMCLFRIWSNYNFNRRPFHLAWYANVMRHIFKTTAVVVHATTNKQPHESLDVFYCTVTTIKSTFAHTSILNNK